MRDNPWGGQVLVFLKIRAQRLEVLVKKICILKKVCAKGWLKITLSMMWQFILEGEEQIYNHIITKLPKIWIIYIWEPLLWWWHPLFLRVTLNFIDGVSMKFETTKIPSVSVSLYESIYRLINHIEVYFHKTISMTEIDHIFIFVCRMRKGMDFFNWTFKLFIIEIDCFFNIRR